jgi:hypothetical protein
VQSRARRPALVLVQGLAAEGHVEALLLGFLGDAQPRGELAHHRDQEGDDARPDDGAEAAEELGRYPVAGGQGVDAGVGEEPVRTAPTKPPTP